LSLISRPSSPNLGLRKFGPLFLFPRIADNGEVSPLHSKSPPLPGPQVVSERLGSRAFLSFLSELFLSLLVSLITECPCSHSRYWHRAVLPRSALCLLSPINAGLPPCSFVLILATYQPSAIPPTVFQLIVFLPLYRRLRFFFPASFPVAGITVSQ